MHHIFTKHFHLDKKKETNYKNFKNDIAIFPTDLFRKFSKRGETIWLM